MNPNCPQPVHYYLAILLAVYGLYVGFPIAVGRDLKDPTWRRHELIVTLVIGIYQFLGSLSLELSTHCGGDHQSSGTYMFGILLGNLFLLVVPWAFVVKDRWATRIASATVTLVMALSYVTMTREPYLRYKDPLDVGRREIHDAILMSLIVTGGLRLCSEVIPQIRLLYAVSVSCVGTLLMMSVPENIRHLLNGVTYEAITESSAQIVSPILWKGILATIVSHTGILALVWLGKLKIQRH